MAQHFVNIHVQHFVNLHVKISWQAQYKICLREIADAGNAVFLHRKVAEAGKSSFAERCVRDGLGSCSDHARIILGIVPPL